MEKEWTNPVTLKSVPRKWPTESGQGVLGDGRWSAAENVACTKRTGSWFHKLPLIWRQMIDCQTIFDGRDVLFLVLPRTPPDFYMHTSRNTARRNRGRPGGNRGRGRSSRVRSFVRILPSFITWSSVRNPGRPVVSSGPRMITACNIEWNREQGTDT